MFSSESVALDQLAFVNHLNINPGMFISVTSHLTGRLTSLSLYR